MGKQRRLLMPMKKADVNLMTTHTNRKRMRNGKNDERKERQTKR